MSDHPLRDELHAEMVAAEKEKLPQLKEEYFATQLFWLVIIFAFLYAFMASAIIPRIRNVLGKRQHQIQHDLDAAEKAKNEATSARHAYESEMENAKAKATALIHNTQKELDQFAASEQKKLSTTLEALLKDSEASLEAKRASARNEIAPMIETLTAQIAESILGTAPSEADVKKAIANLEGAA